MDKLPIDGDMLESFRTEPWRHYREVPIPKSDGTVRQLYVPSERLKNFQRHILRTYLAHLPRHDAEHSRAGRSVLTNAGLHLGHGYVSAFDIADCFPSVTPRHVVHALQRAGVDLEPARLIASLTTFRGQLPQGSPTSSALLGLVLFPVDEQLSAAAMTHGLSYSRYVDDIFVSGNRSCRFFQQEVIRATSRFGFSLAHDKTRHWNPHRRARLAGVVLAAKPSISTEYVQSVARLIHLIEIDQLPIGGRELDSIRGKIDWIDVLRPEAARELRKRLLRAMSVRTTRLRAERIAAPAPSVESVALGSIGLI